MLRVNLELRSSFYRSHMGTAGATDKKNLKEKQDPNEVSVASNLVM